MQPNIILFLTDDHAQWAAGCYGNSEIHTPTLNHLAKTGAQFNNAFTPTPVCSPARACLLTGRMSSQHGVHDYLASGDPDINGNNWLTNETTLPQLLQKQGYETALVGKWHIGDDENQQPGFDHWFSMGRGYPIYHEGPHDYGVDGEHKSLPGRITHVLTERALDFLRTRDQSRPFCLIVGLYATHSPWEKQAERLVAQYRDCTFSDVAYEETYPFGVQNLESTNETRSNQREALAQYYAAVTEIDGAVGRLLDEVESLGIGDETMTVYTADHGLNCGQHGIWGKGNGTLPLNMVEESIRVPLLLHCPALVAPQVRDEMVDHLDTFQSLLDFVGVAAPTGKDYAGVSFRPNLQQTTTPLLTWRQNQYCEYGDVRMIRTHQHKLVRRHPDGPHDLFDLHTDPREMTNLFDVPEHQSLVEQLTTQLNAHFNKYADPIKSGLNVLSLPKYNFSESWRDPRLTPP